MRPVQPARLARGATSGSDRHRKQPSLVTGAGEHNIEQQPGTGSEGFETFGSIEICAAQDNHHMASASRPFVSYRPIS